MVAIAVDGNEAGFNGMLTLNDTGGFILSKLNEETTVEEITKQFLNEYDCTREQAVNTIESFIAKLRDAGLIAE
jgi:sensor domain CHASE-containing protein